MSRSGEVAADSPLVPLGAGEGREVLLAAEGIEKRYGGVHALRGASLHVGAGEVHALVGENGSGKSTLLGVISGQRWPDGGTLRMGGRELAFPDPTSAIAAGISTVTQETTLVTELSVAENIHLGRLPRRSVGIDWRRARQEASEVMERLGLEIDPQRLVGGLRPDQQQLVEVARAISIESRVLILDEPTSSLTDDEVEHLFTVVRRLKDEGVATIFVTHRLNEVFEIADRVTVLRDGQTVGSGPIEEYDRHRMILEMVGREPEALASGEAAHSVDEAVLRVRHLSIPGKVEDVSLDVGAGEIVGLAGLVGAGRSDLFEGLFGLDLDTEADVEVNGKRYVPVDPATAMRAGLGYVPADRKQQGLVYELTVRENLMLAIGAMRWPLARPSAAAELGSVAESFERFNIVASSPRVGIDTLSGGNQQKVLLAKWLQTDPLALLLDEPTRGVDVGAKAEIYRLLQDARQRGVAILVSSSEAEELELLCDRVVVMFRGRVMATLSREEADPARIAHLATGHAE